jgi:xylulokinase
MRGHAERSGMPNPPNRIIATGGGSANARILKFLVLLSILFRGQVYTLELLLRIAKSLPFFIAMK